MLLSNELKLYIMLSKALKALSVSDASTNYYAKMRLFLFLDKVLLFISN